MSDSSGTAAVRFLPPQDGAAYVVGTFDTKARELGFLADLLRGTGLRVVTVDVSTAQDHASTADVSPETVAERHPGGGAAVFGTDRGRAIDAMATALAVFLPERDDLAGVIAAGGSGGTALATRAMQALPVGLPKIMVSTVAAGDVKRYVGAADICLMPSITDVSGLNRISTRVLGNAAHALAGMIGFPARLADAAKPAVGLTMFGVTTPCVQSVAAALEAEYDCIVFHATGTGGQAMEKLADSGLLAGVIDVTTTEIADHLLGGVLSAGDGRLDAIIRTKIPYVGSCGALDMVNFGARDTVPEQHVTRNLYVHNPQVTLMRTLPEENARLGAWIAAKLNRMQGEVRFLLPLGGVSLIDSPGQPFHDPAADRALFDAVRANFSPTGQRRLIELPYEINHPAFAAALVDAFRGIAGPAAATRSTPP